MVHLQLLAAFYLKCSDDSSNGEPLVTITAPHLQALIAYLALHRHTSFTRHQLAYLLWPESSEGQALTNLRGELLKLRRLWPLIEEYIQITRQSLQWHPELSFALDVEEFEQRVTQADRAIQAQQPAIALATLLLAVELYQGPFLPACHEEWVLSKRDLLAQRFTHAQTSLVALLTASGDYPQATEAARRFLHHEPLQEIAYQNLIHLYLLQGDRTSALRLYHECVATLKRELNVEPSAELQSLHTQLLRDNVVQTHTLAQPQSLRSGEPAILVGRQHEWQQLLLAWQRTSQAQALVVSLVGEAGIGKTRLAESLVAWLRQQGVHTASARCYAAEGELAFGPLIELLRSETLAKTLPRLGDMWLAYVARLLPELLERYPYLKVPEGVSDALQRSHFFEALARAVYGDGRPLLLVVEDLHWADREMLEWLRYFVHFAQHKQLMLVVTIRAEEIMANPALQSLLLELRGQQSMVEIQLGRLNQNESAALATQVIGRQLSAQGVAHLYRHTGGNPLFVVEMVRNQVERQAVENSSGHETMAGASEFTIELAGSLPQRMKATLQARLSQLSSPAREVAEVAATIGRSFSVSLLAQAGTYPEDELWQSLDELWQRHILTEQGADIYDFSHPKLRDVAYDGISPIRRRLLHRRVAQAFESAYPQQLDALSGQIAVHYELGSEIPLAIGNYQRAGRFTKQLFAYQETIITFRKALSLLAMLPDSDKRRQQELDILLDLGVAVMLVRGASHPETEELYARAVELAKGGATDARLYVAIWGLHQSYLFQANYAKSVEAAQLCMEMAQQSGDAELLVQAYHALTTPFFYLGGREQLQSIVEYVSHVRLLYQADSHFRHVLHYGGHDPCVCTSITLAKTQWLLGYPDQAINTAQQAVALATQLRDQFTSIIALTEGARVHRYRGEPLEALKLLDQTRLLLMEGQLSNDELIFRGWVIGQLQPGVEALIPIQKAYAAWQAKGKKTELPDYFAMLAETHERLGDLDSANRAVADGLAVAAETGEGYWVCELHRLRGTFLLIRGETPAAQESFEEALRVARSQGARSLELRAAIDLSRLWASQGSQSAAYELLAGLYNLFTEGLNTADLRQAKALLAELSS